MNQTRYRQSNSIKGMVQSARLNMSTVEEDYEEQDETYIRFPKDEETSKHKQQPQEVSKTQKDMMFLSVDIMRRANSRKISQISSKRSSDLSSDNEIDAIQEIDFTPITRRELLEDLQSPINLPSLDILSMIGNYKKDSSYEPIQQQFSVRVSLQIQLLKDDSVYKQGEEIIISRRTLLFNSRLVQYFTKKLQVGNQMVFYEEDTFTEDGPKFRISQLSPQTLRGRSITTTAMQSSSRFLGQRILGKQNSPTASSPTSNTASTKSEKKEFISLKKLIETNNQISRKSSFSMAVEQQQQHQMESAFLRRASKRVHQLQVLQNTSNVGTSSSSDSGSGSDSDSKSSDSKSNPKTQLQTKTQLSTFSEIINRANNIPVQEEKVTGTLLLLQRMDTIEEENQKSSPMIMNSPRLPLLNLSLTAITQSPEGAPVRRQSVRFQKLGRKSSMIFDSKQDIKARVGELIQKFKVLFGRGRHIAFRKQKSWEDDDDRSVQLKIIGGALILFILFLLVVLLLSLIKYKLEKL